MYTHAFCNRTVDRQGLKSLTGMSSHLEKKVISTSSWQ
jgi:hypothetical protein